VSREFNLRPFDVLHELTWPQIWMTCYELRQRAARMKRANRGNEAGEAMTAAEFMRRMYRREFGQEPSTKAAMDGPGET